MAPKSLGAPLLFRMPPRKPLSRLKCLFFVAIVVFVACMMALAFVMIRTKSSTESTNTNRRLFASRDELRRAILEYQEPLDNDIDTTDDLSLWDTSRVTDFAGLFYQTTVDDAAIGHWNTQGVVRMDHTFRQSSYNSPLEWDTSRVTSMEAMFRNNTVFHQDLRNWDTSRVTHMGWMWENAVSYHGDLSSWNLSRVTNFQSMFYNASQFDQDLDAWDTSSATDMGYMFMHATVFNGNVSTWNTSRIQVFTSLFEEAVSFAGGVRQWDLSSTTNVDRMFYNARRWSQNVCHWQWPANASHVGVFEGSACQHATARVGEYMCTAC